MRTILSLFSIISTLYICGCSTPAEQEYRSEEENQLTRGEELLFAQKARIYAKENFQAYRIPYDEAKELDRIAPQIRSYCKAYKYGAISVSWTLNSGNIITIRASGNLLDQETKMEIKVMRIVDQPTEGTLKTQKNARKNVTK